MTIPKSREAIMEEKIHAYKAEEARKRQLLNFYEENEGIEYARTPRKIKSRTLYQLLCDAWRTMKRDYQIKNFLP